VLQRQRPEPVEPQARGRDERHRGDRGRRAQRDPELAPLPPDEVQDYATIRLTAPGRSIVDAAIAGTEPRQIIMAVWQALDRHITTPEELRRLAERGSDTSHRRYVQRIIDETIADHAA